MMRGREKQKVVYGFIFWMMAIVIFYGRFERNFYLRSYVIPPKVFKSDSCKITVAAQGETELQQLKLALSKNTTMLKESQVTSFSYEFYILDKNCRGFMITHLMEYYLKHKTDGGSSFRIEIRKSEILELCSYTDFYNGSYMVYCPMSKDACNDVTIYFMYGNYDAYINMQKKPPQMRQIVQYRYCHDTKPLLHHSLMSLQNQWQYARTHHINGGIIDPFQKKNYCDWLKKLTSFTAIGASHMRYIFDYMLHICDVFPKGLIRHHASYDIGGNHYVLATYTEEYFNHLLKMSKENVTKSKSDILLLMTGAWDLCYLTPGTAFQHLEKYTRLLNNLKNSNCWKNGRIIALTTVPYPQKDVKKTATYRGYRNNFLIAAYNKQMIDSLFGSGIEIFDSFEFLVPLNTRQVVCVNHYLCFLQDKDYNYQFKGQLGIELVKHLITSLMFV